MLPPEHGGVVGPLGAGRRQAVDVDLASANPLGVGMRGRQRLLELCVGHQPALCGINEQHASGTQALAQHDLLFGHGQHTRLGGHDHQLVGGDAVTARPQAVAIEDGADDGAVREGQRGGPVPRFHQRGVVLVERPHGRVHLGLSFPRLGHHHQHGVRQRAPGHDEQLDHIVEGGCITAAGANDGPDVGKRIAEQRRGQQALARMHPGDVALHGVDFAVVGYIAIGMGQRPRREGVGREPLMHQREA